MASYTRTQLGRLIVLPFATIGVLAAVLVWEIEHVGSIALALAIAIGGVTVGVVVARQLAADMDRLAEHYEALLRTADDQSQQVEAAGRAKDEFIATLSHELRTPLNSILGWTRLLGSGKLDDAGASRAISSIDRAGWAQSRLIDDLLDASRIVSGKFQISLQPTSVPHVVDAAVSALRPAADAKHLSVALSLDDSIGPIAADTARLHQAVWHLMSNAIKFTPNGGHISVTLSADHEVIRIVVRDSGVGFTPDTAAHLFERFRQGDSSSTRQFGGLGLGLGLVRQIVELHGGTVRASSAGANLGSVFEMTLPRTEIEAPPAEPAPVSTRAASLQGITVLVVDDDVHSVEFTRETLEQAGATVITATSARDARDHFDRERPNVIVSDIVLPGQNGFDFIRDIRHAEGNGPHTPAAAVTVLARNDDRRRALSAGFQIHLAKPIDPSELVVTVDRLAHGRINPARVTDAA